MSSLEEWEKNNDAYLKAAIWWIKLQLRVLCRLNEYQSERSEYESNINRIILDPKSATGDNPKLDVASTEEQRARNDVSDEDLSQAKSKMDALEKIDPPPALMILSNRLGLSCFEKEILLLCASMELDTQIAVLCAKAQDDPHKPFPTFALALTLFDDPAWDAISPERPLRYFRLIEIIQPGHQPLTSSPLRADEKVVNYIKGLNYLDDRLSFLLSSMDIMPGCDLPPSQAAVAERIKKHLDTGKRRLPIIQLVGADEASKQHVAQNVVSSAGLHLLRLSAELIPAPISEMEALARLWDRERMLLPLALYIDASEIQHASSGDGQFGAASRFLTRCNGITFLDVYDVWPGVYEEAVFDILKPTSEEQKGTWSSFIGSAAPESPALLAGQFNLNTVAIEKIAASALSDRDGGVSGRSLHDRVWEACRTYTRPKMETLARRIDAKATRDDIVLPKAEMDLLDQIVVQVQKRCQVYDKGGFRSRMNRGLGITALFAGESGTGKTMAAEVIANDLQLDLYRIDLSAVVSKYIGETEKNLRKLFDAAEDGGAILFFDEADALFGKRSEVKDSHDRYANIEINYLLQRMEAYSGLAILATNMKSALDQAFVRRLRFIVSFSFPGLEERKEIWEKVFPKETKVEGMDYNRLARFNLTGGSIQNIALNAAFMAANESCPVTTTLVLKAAKSEFKKLERPINEGEFALLPGGRS